MKIISTRATLLAAGISAFAFSSDAKVVLPQFFTDNMVVQQRSTLTIPGKATPNAEINVTTGWEKKPVRATAGDDGSFRIQIKTPKAGGPYIISFDDGQRTELKNVMVGEVWLCSGQSNMEMPLAGWGKVNNYQREIANANYPNIRLLQIKRGTSVAPKTNLEVNMDGWQECSPETVHNFSSIAYFFARDIYKQLNIPIGVIDSSWGGTPAESWTPYFALKGVQGFEETAKHLSDMNFDQKAMMTDYSGKMALIHLQMTKEEANCKVDMKALQPGWDTMNVPGNWELQQLGAFDGIVWMQRSVTIPAEWAGKPAKLHLGSIDDDDTTYWNGEKVGSMSGFQTKREYAVDGKLVKAGEMVLSVRIVDPRGEGGFNGVASDMYIECNGQKIPLAGKWKYKTAADYRKYHIPTPPDDAHYPTVLYNAMINPLAVMPVKGCLWYQGEDNVGRAGQYSVLFKSMIQGWRTTWNNPKMPFYFVQLAGYLKPETIQPDSRWALLREAQADALALPATGMATAIDIGNPNDIHPKNKQEVGRRLALLALNHDYGKKCISEAPAMTEYKVEGNAIVMKFSGKLTAKGGTPKGFIIAGKDGKYYRATATVVASNKIKVEAQSVSAPVSVRYDWADCPDGNLYGQTGLPVQPFRTDR